MPDPSTFKFKSKTILVSVTSDRLGISNPTSRDKLLAAVQELKLFGGPVPDERQFRLNVPGNGNKGFLSPRTKKRSLPTRPSNMQLQNGNTLNLLALYYSNKRFRFWRKRRAAPLKKWNTKLVSNVLIKFLTLKTLERSFVCKMKPSKGLKIHKRYLIHKMPVTFKTRPMCMILANCQDHPHSFNPQFKY